MKKRNKFNKEESDEDEDETSWQDSYSDLMTDLLAIFVILFSFAMMNQAIIAYRASSAQKPKAVAESSAIQQTLPDEDNFNSLIESIRSYINEAGLSEQLSVSKQGSNLILLRAKSSVFFETGLADVKPDAEPILEGISKILTRYSDSIKMVRIEGHTDNRPINNKVFNSNWELSTARAVNVLKKLAEISPLGSDKFSAVGYAEFHPIANNDTAANMAKNRRVDFIIETAGDQK